MQSGFLHPERITKEFDIKKGMAIADFGCGAGYFTLHFARLVGDEGKVSALDIQQSALESVRSRASHEGLFNVKTIWSDLETEQGSKLENQSQDLVFIHNVLFQAPDKKAILKEAKRVVKPKGSVSVIEWDQNALMGPKKEYRVPKETVIEMAEELGLRTQKEFMAGEYHYGLVFTPTA